MVLYNALPKKEYERIFMCKTTKDIWKSLLITHQGNSQVKDNKINLLVQQYKQFTIIEEESINSGFARFNTIIISLKALDECFSSKNYARKFLRALHPKWRAKVMEIKESKDLSSLALDELINNLKVHEVVMEKDSEIYRGKKEKVKSIALKAKKESSDDETSTSGSDDEEYAMSIRNFKKFFRRKDAVIQIISLAIVQNHLATKIKRPSLEVLGSITKMSPKTKPTMKLVSWLNRQMSSTSQNLCDNFAKIMHDEFEMSMIGELNFFLCLQIKQMEDIIFFDQSKYIKEMLKMFRLKDSKPTKTPMSTEIKLTKDDEADSVDSSKYQDMIAKGAFVSGVNSPKRGVWFGAANTRGCLVLYKTDQ
nr:zf-CCHC domain-containing protein/DUF4219 domain-containing protein/UBN2 domain-containing protein [Tanacetum cinerariifolium]